MRRLVDNIKIDDDDGNNEIRGWTGFYVRSGGW
jgi:hypothetical protein